MLVDLEQGMGADLLPDRSAAAFQKWLRQHPEVRMISRDRDRVYADGGYGGAPQAEQVADRFHLVQNLIQAVQAELEAPTASSADTCDGILAEGRHSGTDFATALGAAEAAAKGNPKAAAAAKGRAVSDGEGHAVARDEGV
jgi:hypothetical protein